MARREVASRKVNRAMITREKQPLNLEMPFASLDGAITPTEKFYVRSHFPTPPIELASWRLQVSGAVARPLSVSLDELRAWGAETIEVTIECAGNNRIFLQPKADGVQWELGAVGNARWTGVPLRAVLERAKPDATARDVILEGADRGPIAKAPRPAGEVAFARSLPLGKAMNDVLLAWEMNGKPLTPTHGFPLRAIVPGWYGMAAVKWLERVIVSAVPFHGYFETVDYAYWAWTENGPVLTPLREMQVKAQIARPENGEVVQANQTYAMQGAAWTGEAEIVQVEVSTDAGETWHDARLRGDSTAHRWRLWEFDWKVPAEPGAYTLMARASDSRGRTQPRDRDANRGSYMISHWLPVMVEVR